jgi:hypothetical protein
MMNVAMQLAASVEIRRGYLVLRWHCDDPLAVPPLIGQRYRRTVNGFRRGAVAAVKLNHRVLNETDRQDYEAQQLELGLTLMKPIQGERYFRLRRLQ